MIVKPDGNSRISKMDISVNPGDHSVHRAKPCPLCARQIIQAGIRNVILRTADCADGYEIVQVKELEWFTGGEENE